MKIVRKVTYFPQCVIDSINETEDMYILILTHNF